MRKNGFIEILSPCADMTALKAAICAGADAVYFGLDDFNARMRAKNFDFENLPSAVALCHAHNVKAYVTLNVAVYERETEKIVDYVSKMYVCGVDAIIVSDLGVAKIIKRKFPDFPLHASTQCTAHSLDGVKFLHSNGFDRVVIARELDKKNIEYICKNSPCEIEMFVHGAHCMSVSGQCLMSYSMGGRSGNRGECAQPCRLPYRIGKEDGYFLSLKDMSLSNHMEEILKCGVKSLKIEGRMKSADYVYNVTKVYRTLADEGRNITESENKKLEEIFSRQGFTDGFYMSDIGSNMLGIRSEKNKAQTAGSAENREYEVKKVKINLKAKFISGKSSELTLYNENGTVICYGDTVEEAKNCPMEKEDIIKNLSKLGITPFEAGDIDVEKSDNIIIPVSKLNALRREAVNKFLGLDRKITADIEKDYIYNFTAPAKKIKSALFSKYEQIPREYDFFDIRFIYADRYKKDSRINGICLPPVIFDSETDEISEKINTAKADGVEYILVSNIGQTELAKKSGMKMIADFRFNVFNRASYDFLRSLGFEHIILSPELILRQSGDVFPDTLIVYGKIPVMTTQKCIIKDTAGCKKCSCYMIDRKGAPFYVEGIYGHRNIIYNSVPIYMADKHSDIKNFSSHFIFTNETEYECGEIINAYKNKLSTDKKIRRIK